ncbi:MAG TPA: GNAT family N-acetyltransferase [Candidatus Acidoferrales bacterium]|nr:GNAT family N-acetyltransferase [Candidatus Acidoferrales bacterium]
MTQRVAVKVFRHNSEIESIRPIWEGWHSHPNADIEFYNTIVRARPEVIRPHIMVAFRDDCPQAMLVGRIELKRLAIKTGYLTLFRPNVRMLTLPFGGLLGDGSDESCAALIDGVIETLRRGEADLAVFEPINTKSAFYSYVRTSPAWFCRDYIHTIQVHRSMTLFESAEAFRQSLSPKVRKNLKWQAKKMFADYSGEIRLATYGSAAELEVVFADVEEIARKTYQRALDVGFSDNSENRARLQLEAEKGWLRAYILYVANKPCAFWLGTLYKGTFHSDFMGYDPAFAKYSPGTYLVANVIDELCQAKGPDKLVQLDFGLGDAQYKQVLGTNSWYESGPYIFAPSAKGLILNLVWTSSGLLDRSARRVLAATNLLPRIKKLWRTSARRSSPQSGNEGVA